MEEQRNIPVKSRWNFDTLMELGDLCVVAGDCDRANAYYQQAAQINPNQAQVYVRMGALAMEQKCYDQAESYYLNAIEIDPQNSKAYCGLGIVCQHQHNCRRAADMFEKALAVEPDNLNAILGLYQTSVHMDCFDQIKLYLETYFEKHPDDVSILFCLATICAREKYFQHAVKLLNRILTLDPTYSEAEDLLEEVHHEIDTQ